MRVTLRSKAKSAYYAGPGIWTQNPTQAVELASFEHAVAICGGQSLTKMEAVVRYEAINAEVNVPIPDFLPWALHKGSQTGQSLAA